MSIMKLQNPWNNYGLVIRGDPVEMQRIVDIIEESDSVDLKYIKCSELALKITTEETEV